MKKQAVYFILGIIIILLSVPLGYKLANMTIFSIIHNVSTIAERIAIFKGYMYSLFLVGFLLFTLGIVSFFFFF